MIFIAYNHDGLITSIVSAKTEASALAYWQGKDCLPYSHKQFDLAEDRANENMGFVTPILNTREIEPYAIDRNSNKKLLIVSNK